MVKIVDMTSALQQVREKAPDTADAMKRFKSGNAGFTDKAHLKAKGMIPRADGTKKVSPKYEDLDKKDVATIKPIIKQLQKSVKSHDKQAKQLAKDISDEKDLEEGIKPYVSMQRDSKTNKMNYVVLDKDEKEVYRSSDERLAKDYLRKNFSKLREDLEEQVKDLEEQLKTAEQELEELYIKEDKAYVIRFKRIKDKERMVVVFRNQNDADMYADNIKKQGGQVFSNKLEKIPYKVVDKK